MREVLVDANILLRHLTGQPPDLAAEAAVILGEAEAGRLTLVVTPLVVAECVWVLESVYRQSREAIADALAVLIEASGVAAREHDVLVHGLGLYRDMRGLDFADAYLVSVAIHVGPRRIATFDRDLRRVPGIEMVAGSGGTS